ncbi:alpha/beta hydrolase family protein [Portibacter marinus]|uniref:alpha/beta hydrolase family protein n=1 Tax=Portibacter marinus TaxID=2898660 RepID=UPI001F37D860|nr:prolyl oligopeptidase family serine peptidase [Portibacter marinus]
MKLFSTLLIILGFTMCANGQMKVMDQSAYIEWKEIESESTTDDGQWIKYHLTPGRGDKVLYLYDTSTKEQRSFTRVGRSSFTDNGRFLVFTRQAATDTIEYKRRRKVEKKDLPKDTLVVLDLETMNETLIPDIGTYKIPENWSGIIAYQAEIPKMKKDSSAKKEMEQSFFIYDLKTNYVDTLENVTEYQIAEEEPHLVFSRNTKDTTVVAGVFMYNVSDKSLKPILQENGKYKNLVINKSGDRVSFISDRDTTKARIRPYELHYWSDGTDKIPMGSEDKLGSDSYQVTENTKPRFSDNGEVLYFGIGSSPVLADSLALDEEQVQVEVWTTADPMLYTMQELQEDRLRKETYDVRYDEQSGILIPLEDRRRKSLQVSQKGDGKIYLLSDREPYEKEVTWMGRSKSDVYIGEVGQGVKLFKSGLSGNPGFSPTGKYLYWFDRDELAWKSYNVATEKEVNLTEGMTGFTDELNDRPMQPGPYGMAGWSTEDQWLYLYDRYDVWKFDPSGVSDPVNLTKGRQNQIEWRVIDLDREEDALDENAFMYVFNERTKESGYGRLNLEGGEPSVIVMEDMSYDRRPLKAKNADRLVFTKESFEIFPDLLISQLSLENTVKISDANPQQSEYRWGSIELFKWQDYNGDELEGLLVKPEGFDPSKKYPVIVNFYERSSDGLHRHRAPEPHRSTINYSYYANKGYVIFNPDVKYEIGDPGQSAYNAVVSGVEALSKNTWIDKDRIGIQGHSWGGYQIAHILNKTDIFRCAESGAPVVNMVSAYGGIRWGSGMSRMFQYEKTQSRLGATLWEDPEAYLRNSPIFEVDQMNTPVLILHNDNDGAVPWYQGIEYYMALRRLGKPAWFLNYNGEPHWPLKWHNRLDFNKRMEQFFAHYLLDEPMPLWMKKGVSVVDKGINQGFELEEE